MTLSLLLMVFAFVFLALAAGGVSFRRIHFGWLGMTFWCASILFGSIALRS